jgi:acetyl esterase/lipase
MKRFILALAVLAVLAGQSVWGQDAPKPAARAMPAYVKKALDEYKATDPKGYNALMKLRETDPKAFREQAGKIVRESRSRDGAARKQPAKTKKQPPFKLPDTVKIERNIVHATYGERKVMMDLYLPKDAPAGKIPCIMTIHGGGWRNGSKEKFARQAAAFAENGFAAACVGYRLRPEVDIPQCIEDVKAATRWMRANAAKYNIDPDRFGAYGGSAGAHLAAILGTSFKAKQLEGKGGNEGVSSRVHAVVALATPSDFTRFGRAFQGDKDTAKRISPITYVDADSAQFLLMHARGDRTVPYSQSTLLLEKLRAAKVPAALTTIETQSHAFWNGTSKTAAKSLTDTIAFFNKTLKNTNPKSTDK